jgi:hypothetical protein
VTVEYPVDVIDEAALVAVGIEVWAAPSDSHRRLAGCLMVGRSRTGHSEIG